jgi:hypothetical protein
LTRQLSQAVRAELDKIREASMQLTAMEWRPVSVSEPSPLQRVAIVAADAGNVNLRLAPLRIGFVRVASSSSEAPLAEIIFPSETPARDLAYRVRDSAPHLLQPLEDAGVGLDELFEGIDHRTDRLAAVREILEWGAIVGLMQRREDHPLLVIRDGLLRSISLEGRPFERISAAVQEASRATRNHLVAVAKQVPGGADLINRLMVGGVLDRAVEGLSCLQIPIALEQELLPASFVKARRMGPLLLVRLPGRLGFAPVESASEDQTVLDSALDRLFGDGAEFWPQAGMPVEIEIAHQRARVSALDREWLRAAFIHELEQSDVRLARRALAAEVLGIGGTLVTDEPSRDARHG